LRTRTLQVRLQSCASQVRSGTRRICLKKLEKVQIEDSLFHLVSLGGSPQPQTGDTKGCHKGVPQRGATKGCHKGVQQRGATKGCNKGVPQIILKNAKSWAQCVVFGIQHLEFSVSFK